MYTNNNVEQNHKPRPVSKQQLLTKGGLLLIDN